VVAGGDAEDYQILQECKQANVSKQKQQAPV
jgi:hypothetical protein